MSNDDEFLNFYQKLKSDQGKSTTDNELANLLRQEGFLLYNESLKKADNYIPSAIAKEHFANYSDLVSKIGNNSVNNYTSAVVNLLKANNKVVNTSMWATSIGNPEDYFTSQQSLYTDCSCEEFHDSDLTDFPVCSEGPSPTSEDVDSSKNHITNQIRSDLRLFLTRQENDNAPQVKISQKETSALPKLNPCLPSLLQTLPPKSTSINAASLKPASLNLSSPKPHLSSPFFNLSSSKPSPILPSTSNNINTRQINEQKKETITSFRTAKDELLLQNVKKYGTANPNNQQPLFSYGASKKSLGARRTVKNSFVPPIKQDEIENHEISNMQVDESPMDERLRNIDPKMIELISSEIMHKFKPIAWSDIAGLEYAKKTIQEAVVWPLLRPDIFTGLRRPPRGILLFGPPGTGKTLIGKCIASQSKSTFFSISASSLTSKWIGDGEKMVRALFAVAAVNQPSVVFIDEIDSLLCQRSETEHESSRRIKTEFLVQLDGAATSEDERILIVGATNRPQELDEAARRRLIRRLYIPLPEVEARLQILTNLLKSVKHSMKDEQILEIANLTDGYSGADMECLCREASMEPIRSIPPEQIPYFDENEVRPINFEDFRSALGRIRASVSQNDLKQYIEWNNVYGSGNVR